MNIPRTFLSIFTSSEDTLIFLSSFVVFLYLMVSFFPFPMKDLPKKIAPSGCLNIKRALVYDLCILFLIFLNKKIWYIIGNNTQFFIPNIYWLLISGLFGAIYILLFIVLLAVASIPNRSK